MASRIPLSPSLRAAVRDGMGYAAMVGAGETYLSAFGIFLGASTVQVGVLATLPQLIGALCQNIGVWFLEQFRCRRPAIVAAVLANSLTWIFIALLALSYGSVTWLIGLAAVYFAVGGFIAPLWSSLMRDLLPVEIRGRFFGLRNHYTGMVTFLAVLCAGGLLHSWERFGHAEVGFALMFLVAAAARLYSAFWLNRYDDPPVEIRPEHRFTFIQFLRRAPRSNFARFVFFGSTINFAVALSGPYFGLFMLRELQFTYLQFTVVTAAMTVTQFLTMQHWGTLGDRFGSKRVLNLCGFGICLSPMLWIFSHELWWILIVQTYSGFVWAGYNLATAHFVFDAVTPQKLPRCTAYQAIVNGVFLLAGSLLGGYTAGHLPNAVFGIALESNLLIIFLLSGVLRFAAACYFLPRFKEVRTVEQIRHRDLIFLITNLRPIAGATFGVVSSILKEERRRRPKGGDHNVH